MDWRVTVGRLGGRLGGWLRRCPVRWLGGWRGRCPVRWLGGWRGRWRTRHAPTEAERGLLAAAGGGAASPLVLTRSRVDVGHWLGRGRLWAACLPDALLLVAAGKRPHLERVPLEQLGMTMYNPMTGELVLLPAPQVRQRALRLAPADGWRLLEGIKQEDSSHA